MSIFSDIGDAISDVTSVITPGVGSLLGAGLSGISSLIGGENQNSAAAASVQQQEQFQNTERLDTYPDTVASMEAAGLNPMLAYSQGGLPVPSGNMYSPVNPMMQAASSALQGSQIGSQPVQNVQTATSAALNSAQVANTQAQTASTLAGLNEKEVGSDIWGTIKSYVAPVAAAASHSAAASSSFMDNVRSALSGTYKSGSQSDLSAPFFDDNSN